MIWQVVPGHVREMCHIMIWPSQLLLTVHNIIIYVLQLLKWDPCRHEETAGAQFSSLSPSGSTNLQVNTRSN